jgi:aquaporin Z
MLNYIVEFIGTFIFLSVIISVGHAIPIGLILAGMIYWGGSISGGNFNPAVSVMMYMHGKLSLQDMILYIICQILGGVAAFLLYKQTAGLSKQKIHYQKNLS